MACVLSGPAVVARVLHELLPGGTSAGSSVDGVEALRARDGARRTREALSHRGVSSADVDYLVVVVVVVAAEGMAETVWGVPLRDSEADVSSKGVVR